MYNLASLYYNGLGVAVDYAKAREWFQKAAEQGYCCTEGLSHTFRYCMAAPIRDRTGLPVAALCFMTSRDTDPDKRTRMLEDLITSSKALSQPYVRL